MSSNWVMTWGQAHAALSWFYYPSAKKTYRFIISSAISGEAIRINLSNTGAHYFDSNIKIGGITVSHCDKNGAVKPNDFTEITFQGQKQIFLRKGMELTTDKADFKVDAGEYFCISIFVEKGSLRSGNLLDNITLINRRGDFTHTENLEHTPRVRDGVRHVAAKILGFDLAKPIPLIDSVELLNTDDAKAIVLFGDSLTQQGHWSNQFETKIRENYPSKYSVINKSIMGNRVTFDGHWMFPARGLYGIAAKTRFDYDVLPYDNIAYTLFFEGINDFIEYGSISAPKSQEPDPQNVLGAAKEISSKLHSIGSKMVFMTVIPFGECVDWRPEKEILRNKYNEIARTNKESFDYFIDIDEVIKNPEDSAKVRPGLLGKDNLHINDAGGKVIVDNIPMDIFK